MTAITLNLLAEEQLAELANARDPVKVAAAIGVSLLMISVLIGSALYVVASQKKADANLLQARYDELVAAETAGATAQFKTTKSLADDVVAINRSRPLFAPQLALLKDLVPDSIQLARIGFSVSIESKDAGGGSDEASGADAKGKDKSARTPKPKNVEHVSLQLDGRAVSGRPEIEVDNFLQTLRSNAAFTERVQRVQLRSIARASMSSDAAAANVPAAQFVIECQYRDQR